MADGAPVPKKSIADRIKSWRSRCSALTSERKGGGWDTTYREIAQFICPRGARFTTSDRNRGQRKDRHILNNTAVLAQQRCAAGMFTGTANPSTPWFILDDDSISEDDIEARAWLYICTQQMLSVMARSNFYVELMKTLNDETTFGTGAMGIFEDDHDVIRCKSYVTGTYVIANNSRGRVDTFYHPHQMTLRSLVQQFGLDALSDRCKSAWNAGNHDIWIDIVHVIEPNDEWDKTGKALSSARKQYVSAYYEASESNKALKISGFDEFPLVVGRWKVRGEDVYGESPAFTALGDTKELQVQEFQRKKAIELQVNPPLNVPPGMRTASLLPGALNEFTAAGTNDAIKPTLQVEMNLAWMQQDTQSIEQRIKDAFFEDVWLAITSLDKSGITATEIQQRIQERLLQLGPVLLQNNDDLFTPAIDRIFSVCLRRGLFPDPPDSLKGRQINIKFTGMLQQAMRRSAVSTVEQFLQFVATYSQIYPGLVDTVDYDKVADRLADEWTVPSDILNSMDIRNQARQQRAQAQAQQELAASAQPVQQAASAAKDLAQVPTSGDNALSAIIQATQGGMGG